MKIKSRFLTKCIAWVAAWMSRMLFATCKKKIILRSPESNLYDPEQSGRYLYCVWHDSLLVPVFVDRPLHTSCLVSRHQDGSYLADALQIVGMIPVRGSSSRGGAKAVRQLITETEELHIVITPDGPRGPRRQLKQGIVYLASKLNRPIVPIVCGSTRAWRFQGSWTDLLVPKPFSTVTILGGNLFHVPHNATKEQLKQSLEQLQTIMDQLDVELEQIVKTGNEQTTAVRDESNSKAA